MQNFFRRPRKHFNGLAWTVLIGFKTVAGPFRFGTDADYAIGKLRSGRLFLADLATSQTSGLAA
ncbi:hypothetical protein [Lichenicoccus sp.]|uniref:hypothetical protein n=1 Tax=Lichenicoccus sp. TaxID=2781899 RepID=UPI003D11EC91